MKTVFFILFVSVIFFVGFWYIFLPNQTLSSVEGGVRFDYPARISLLESVASVDDFTASFAETPRNGSYSKDVVATVSVILRGSDVSLENVLLMRRDETYRYSIESSVQGISTKKYDGIQYTWVDGTVGGKTVVLDGGNRIIIATVRKTTPELIKALNLIISTIELTQKK